MSKKFIPVMFALMGMGLFVASRSMGNSEPRNDENPKIKYAKILRNVGILLEQGHYNPKKIDDDFSKAVLKKFIADLDDEKNVFLQSDIEALKKYDNVIDNEIHGDAEVLSFFAVNEIYLKRQGEVSKIYKDVLAKPFDFNVDEKIQTDPDKINYPADEAARKEIWRKRMKLMALGKYSDLLADRLKNKDKKDYKYKADSTLERESRDFVRKTMDRYFTTKKTRETVDVNFSVFVNAIAGSMDPHTDYFAPVDLRSFNESMKGSFYGIGAVLKEEDGKIKIGTIVTGMPAWKSHELKENDEIIKIGQGSAEPIDVTGYSVQDAVKLIRGSEKGTEVRLTVRKVDGSIKVIPLIRDDIDLGETFAKSAVISNTGHKIGYIYLPEFYADFDNPKGRRCAADVAKEIVKLKSENVEGIVLDLRGNGGGSLYDVVQMAGLFIEDGPIVQVKSRDEKPNVLRDRDKSVLYTGPLAVMVDETSASASEIFAAAIQDYKRGIIIGSTSSYGKGTVQRNIPLNPESETSLLNTKSEDLGTLKLTLQKFYRINGDATQMKGVEPDVVIPDMLEYFKYREKDNPYALKYDEISKTDYKTWNGNENIDGVVSAAKAEIAASPNFSKIKSNVKELGAKFDNKEYSLNLKEYEADQKQLKSLRKDIEESYKLKNPLDVKPIAADAADISKTKENEDRSKAFVKRISEDIYIDESVKIVGRMILNDNTARKN